MAYAPPPRSVPATRNTRQRYQPQLRYIAEGKETIETNKTNRGLRKMRGRKSSWTSLWSGAKSYGGFRIDPSINIPIALVGLLCGGAIIVYLKKVFIPFCFAVLLVYLLRPIVVFISTPRSLRLCKRVDLEAKKDCSEVSIHTGTSATEGVNQSFDYGSIRVDPRGDGKDVIVDHSGRSEGSPILSKAALVQQVNSPKPRSKGGASKPYIFSIPRWLAALASIFFVLGFICILLLLVSNDILYFKKHHLAEYENELDTLNAEATAWINSHLHVQTELGELFVQEVKKMIYTASFVKYLLVDTTGIMANLAIVCLFVVYLLNEEHRDHDEDSIFKQMNARIQMYIGLKTFISASVGVCSFLIYRLIGLQLATFFSVATLLLNFIPNLVCWSFLN